MVIRIIFRYHALFVRALYLYASIVLVYLTRSLALLCTVNVLDFRTLYSIFTNIKRWLSGLEFTKCLPEKQTRKTLIRLFLQKQSDQVLCFLSIPYVAIAESSLFNVLAISFRHSAI